MADVGYCWCPECKKWVPEHLMNIDHDDDGQLIRVCTPCLEGTSQDNHFVYDPNFDRVQCVYCDSFNTVEQAPQWNTFMCMDCGQTFRRL